MKNAYIFGLYNVLAMKDEKDYKTLQETNIWKNYVSLRENNDITKSEQKILDELQKEIDNKILREVKLTLNKGTKELFERIKEEKGIKILYTNTPKQIVYETLEQIGIENSFEGIISSQDLDKKNPLEKRKLPRHYIKLIKMLKEGYFSKKSEPALVADNKQGNTTSAQHAGITGYLIDSKQEKPEEKNCESTIIPYYLQEITLVKDLEQLREHYFWY